MPRDGSGTYHRPPGIDAVTNTTISSVAYNTNVQDVESDLNLPRPVAAGGTGSSTPAGALANLGGESFQQNVTNYNSNTFKPGSFYSASTATGAPIAGHAFTGICYQSDANNMFVEARDLNDTSQPGRKWTRQMTANVWSNWATDASVYVSDSAPTTASDNSLWWESDTGMLYIKYNDGDSSQWVIAMPMPDTTAFLTASQAVRYDAPQTLTENSGTTLGQRGQARSNIAAAPIDALSYSGLQINGSMEVSQELGFSAPTNANGKYGCDGWALSRAGTMVTALGPAPTTVFPGFSNLLGMNVTTAQASLGAGDFATFMQPIEGYRVARLGWGTANAQPITIAFWTCHSLVGTYTGVVRNSATDRTYAFSYTHNVAGTAEYKTVTIPGCTTGTWLGTNGIGMYLIFSGGCGTTYTAPSLNTWLNSNYVSGPGQVNVAASTSNNMYFTGVVVLPGIEAPSASRAPLIMRPYDQELLTCKRYLWFSDTLNPTGTTAGMMGAYALGTDRVMITGHAPPVVMRGIPSYTIYFNGTANLWSDRIAGSTGAPPSFTGWLNESGFTAYAYLGTSTVIANHFYSFDLKLDARL